jgi:hypothetical protein
VTSRRLFDAPNPDQPFCAGVIGSPRPVDVTALLWAPIHALEFLLSGIPADKADEHGIEVLIDKPLDRATLLQIPAGGTEAMLCRVVAEYGANALG